MGRVAQDIWERIGCPICGTNASDPFVQTFDRFDPEREPQYGIVQCRGCGFVYLNPRPKADAMTTFYSQEGYDPFQTLEVKASLYDRIYRLIREINLHWKLRFSSQAKAPGRLLDIGCATGEFPLRMQAKGWQVQGIETDPAAAAYARNRGVSVFKRVRKLEDNARYSLITLWHVLEHIHDLRGVLQKIARMSTPGGQLIIAVPNIRSLDFQRYGKDWIALDAPRHLYHFDRESMRSLIEPYGFHLAEIRPLIWDVFYNHLLSNMRKNRKFTGCLNAIIGILISFLYSWFSSQRYTSSLVYRFIREKNDESTL